MTTDNNLQKRTLRRDSTYSVQYIILACLLAMLTYYQLSFPSLKCRIMLFVYVYFFTYILQILLVLRTTFSFSLTEIKCSRILKMCYQLRRRTPLRIDSTLFPFLKFWSYVEKLDDVIIVAVADIHVINANCINFLQIDALTSKTPVVVNLAMIFSSLCLHISVNPIAIKGNLN